MTLILLLRVHDAEHSQVMCLARQLTKSEGENASTPNGIERFIEATPRSLRMK